MSCSPHLADDRPEWFVSALADAGEDHCVTVRGATVTYRRWGPPGTRPVVLVHGGAAHAGWWDHVAPLLALDRRVVALDLTGHGSSDSRQAYDFETWADEVLAVARCEADGDELPVVVGHSMGGVVALTAAHRHAERLGGVVAIDVPDWVLHGREITALDELPPRRHHATRSQAESRFRARPDDPARLGYVSDHVASRSVHSTDAGWTWRFDHAVTTHGSPPDEAFGASHCPVCLVIPERSLLTDADTRTLAARLGDVGIIRVPDSGHHVMLDQPLSLVAALEGVLAGWQSSLRPLRTDSR